MLCHYNCGKEGVFQFKNGCWCCSPRFDQCSEVIRRRVETRKAKGPWHSDQVKQRIGDSTRGRVLSDEWKQKISIAGKGRKLGPQSDDHKQKNSAAHLGKTPWNKGLTAETDERVAKYVTSQTGKPKNVGQIPWNKGLKKQESLEIISREDIAYADFKKYRNRVAVRTRKTYKQFKSIINPNDLPIGKCGVDGAHQVDHIITVREGFERGISIEDISAKENLQVIPWLDNNQKYDGKGLRKSYIKGNYEQQKTHLSHR